MNILIWFEELLNAHTNLGGTLLFAHSPSFQMTSPNVQWPTLQQWLYQSVMINNETCINLIDNSACLISGGIYAGETLFMICMQSYLMLA